MASFKANAEAKRNQLASATETRSEMEPTGPSNRASQYQGRSQLREACLIRVDRITADPDQPRVEFDDESLERLARSLKERGQLQPCRVRWDDAQGRYIVVVGERRWRAARLAGLESLACVVVPGNATPEEILEDQLVENCLREDLRPVEQGNAFKRLLETRGLSQRQLAERLHVSQASIAKSLALLNLPGAIQADVDSGAIGPIVAYELSKVTDPGEQAELARDAAAGGLKRDEIKARTRGKGAAKARSGAAPRGKGKGRGRGGLPAELRHRAANGVRVVVTTGGKHGRGDVAAALREFAERIEGEERDAA